MSNSLASDLSIWDFQSTVLCRDFRVLRYDMRGHGGSASAAGDYTVALLASDLLALLDQLSIEHIHFVGISLGGMVGQHLGVFAKPRILSLSLCATSSETPPGVWEPRLAIVHEQGLAPIVEPTLSRWFVPLTRKRAPDLIESTRRMVAATTLDGYIGGAAALRDFNMTNRLGEIAAPTLLVAGEKDVSTPPSGMARMREHIPDSQLVVLPDAAHMLSLERPIELAGLIGGFLDRVCRGEPTSSVVN